MAESPVEQWQLDLPGHTLTVALYKDVTNARWVRRLSRAECCHLPAGGAVRAAGPLAVSPSQPLLIAPSTPSRSALRDLVVAGSLEPECALVNAALVPDALVLRAAATKALLAAQRGALRCKSPHAELVFNLSGSKHVRPCSAGGTGSGPLTCCPTSRKPHAALCPVSCEASASRCRRPYGSAPARPPPKSP